MRTSGSTNECSEKDSIEKENLRQDAKIATLSVLLLSHIYGCCGSGLHPRNMVKDNFATARHAGR
jgi:hypothetical protein